MIRSTIVRSLVCALVLGCATGMWAADDVTLQVWYDGEVQGTSVKPLTLTVGDNDVAIPTEGLSIGPHLITMRVTDAKGNTSTAYTRVVYIAEGGTVSAAEYFIDTDPGEGHGVALTVGNGSTIPLSIPTGNLSVGLHTLYARACDDNGKWGPCLSRTFMVTGNGVMLEWFFGDDPGVGKGHMAEAAIGENIIPISTAGLSEGPHLLSFRCHTSESKISVTYTRVMYVTPELPETALRAEYFWDNDPGEGYGINLPVATDGTIALSLPTDRLTPGIHTLTVRNQLANGRWWSVWAGQVRVSDRSGITEIELVDTLTVDRIGDHIILTSKDMPASCRVSVVSVDGVVRGSAEWANPSEPLTLTVPANLRNLILTVDTPQGRVVRRIH